MSRENNSFRDYRGDENSEDEEYIQNLQSRLYAEVYYKDVKNDMNTQNDFPSISVNDSVFYNNTPEKINRERNNESSDAFIREKNDIKSNTIEPCKCCYQCGSSNKSQTVTNSESDKERKFIKKIEDVRLTPNIISEQKIIITNVLSYQLKDKDAKSSKLFSNDKSILCSVNPNEIRLDKEIFNSSGAADQSNVLNVTLKGSLDTAVSTDIKNQAVSNTSLDIVNQADPKIPEEDQLERECSKNLLSTYEFSKQFINRLYLDKYKELQEKLNALESEAGDRSDDDVVVLSVVRAKTNTRRNILDKQKKGKEIAIDSEKVMMISDDSDSEASILEVPVPPKPNPPVINLQDSDEDSVILSCNNDPVEETCTEDDVTNEETRNSRDITWILDKENWWEGSETDQNKGNVDLPEDILLNCMVGEVEKDTSNPKENSINVQLERNEVFDKNQDCVSNHESDVESTENVGQVNNVEQGNMDQSAHSNSVQQKKKDESTTSRELDLDFADDKIIEVSISPSETSKQSRKRSYEYANDGDANNKQVRCISNENENNDIVDKERDEQSWTEYFFRPMSDKIRAFYSESRGQENFNINELQRNMSKDPRLWTVLEEDLTARHRKRLRFWHLKCTNCQSDGHQRHNCPLPRRPPKCHMCGIEGHTESRCPEKMCLTCGKRQGTFRKTCESCRTLYCSMCNAVGHKSVECPDLWRRFHHTTNESDMKVPENSAAVMKPTYQLSCCNCTKRGHDSSTCKEYRWSPHFPTPAFVSNYNDGPRYTDGTTNIISKEITRKGVKSHRTKNDNEKSHRTENDNEEIELILYTCGVCASAKRVKQRIIDISSMKYVQLNGLISRRVKPTFLQKLLRIVKFEVKIYKRVFGNIILFIKTFKQNMDFLKKLIIHWLKLSDDEKDDGIVILPYEISELMPILSSKLQELDETCVKTPAELWEDIKHMRKQLKETKETAEKVTIQNRLLKFQSKFLAIIDGERAKGKSIRMIREQITLKRKNEKVMKVKTYLGLLFRYNEIFAPHIPMDKLHEIEKYTSDIQLKQNEKKHSAKTIKPQKVTEDSYTRFINELKHYNKMVNHQQHKETPVVISNTSNKRLSAHAESASRNSQRNNIEIIRTTNNITERISESSEINTKESVQTSVQSSHTTEISDVPNTKKTDPKCITPSNFIEIIPQLSTTNTTNTTNAHESQSTTGNVYFLDVQGTVEPTTSEKEVEEKSVNSGTIAESSSGKQQVVENEKGNTVENQNTKTKAKAKTKTKSKTSQSPSKTSKKKGNVQDEKRMALINNAKSIIGLALRCHVPYLTKAANEVKKKLDNNDIQQKHVDLLKRIVKRETAQRKAISSLYKVL